MDQKLIMAIMNIQPHQGKINLKKKLKKIINVIALSSLQSSWQNNNKINIYVIWKHPLV
jgi:hypothetical protein